MLIAYEGDPEFCIRMVVVCVYQLAGRLEQVLDWFNKSAHLTRLCELSWELFFSDLLSIIFLIPFFSDFSFSFSSLKTCVYRVGIFRWDFFFIVLFLSPWKRNSISFLLFPLRGVIKSHNQSSQPKRHSSFDWWLLFMDKDTILCVLTAPLLLQNLFSFHSDLSFFLSLSISLLLYSYSCWRSLKRTVFQY